MSPFSERFPELAESEQVVLRVLENGLPLPPGQYGFLELYCADAGCDCRRALLQVVSPQRPGRILATINYGWESAEFYTRWMHGDKEAGRDITSACLDPLNPQSELAEALLDAFRDYVRRDSFYPAQLQRHYEMFKSTQPSAPAVAAAPPAPPLMTPDEILRQLQQVPDQAEFAPYESALRAAADQREAITPALIAALDRVSADPAHYLKNHEECLHLFAILLLAQFRERRALDAFLRFFSLPGEDALNLTGDMVTENGAALIASVCGGDPAPLLRLAQDEAVNEFVRSQAIDGLLVQSLWGERPREAVVDDLRRLFSTLPKPGNGFVWAALAGAVCDFNTPELLPEARQAFASEWVDESIIGLKDLEQALLHSGSDVCESSEQRLAHFRERNGPIDAVAECSHWLCFADGDADEYFLPKDNDGIDDNAEPFTRALANVNQPYIAPPKVGRNDPCPCGSGKKHKKCCGQN